ncbi:N-acetylmuramoyl-L-alanine amidase [Rhodococcus erythropolis]|uniref:peptidoglycan recognition protein family protein n=1 Tax=Rhodococcus baikonurensis TaxID=172041 RepID=UPI00339AB7D1
MTWTGDPVWLADVLRAEGLNVIETPGWKERGHGDFRDIRGVICHHTAGGGSNDWRIVLNGRPDLEGPLAQLVLEKDGTFRVIAVGVCWHAGRGSWPGWPTNDANWHTIGIEAVSRGTAPWDWTPAQLDAYKRGCAAIMRKLGRRAD